MYWIALALFDNADPRARGLFHNQRQAERFAERWRLELEAEFENLAGVSAVRLKEAKAP